MTARKPAIYEGMVVHKRTQPKEHILSYRVFSFLMDVDCFEQHAKALKFFSLNRFNLFSIRERDHGYRNDKSISKFAWETVERSGFKPQVESISILFYPRMFGFAFNPLCVYYCLNGDGQPVLMIYEVRNTFGENLTYVIPAGVPRNSSYSHDTPKRFYVSPFNNVEGSYTFRVDAPEDSLSVNIALNTSKGHILNARFSGKAHAITDKKLLRLLWAYPLMTLKVVAGIHWEALKLWRKGLPLKERPKAPEDWLVFEDSQSLLSPSHAKRTS